MKQFTALVIDDDRLLAQGFALALDYCGFEVAQLHDGTSALDEINRLRPDVVTLDVRMARVSGVEILQGIRNDARVAGTYVIMTTASGTTAQDEIVNRLADLILVKPITLSQLTSFAARFAESRRAAKTASE